METNKDIHPTQLSTQIRDVEILYRALSSYYWKGSVQVFSSFNSLPRGAAVPDSVRVVLKQESYDSLEHGRQRYYLRLLVRTPDMASLVARKTVYPDNQVTFYISPNANDASCAMLFYVFTAERDRRVCCPYAAGASLQLMNTEVSQVLSQGESYARDALMRDIIPSLPLHRAGFRRLDQKELHGFLIMRHVYYSPESEKHDTFYWRTQGIDSQVQLTMDSREATCCRVSSAFTGDDSFLLEERLTEQNRLGQKLERADLTMHRHTRHDTPLLEKKFDKLSDPGEQYPYTTIKRALSLNHSNSDMYSVFVRDTALVWSAFYRYVTGADPPSSSQPQNTFRAFLTSNTLLPYHPPPPPGAVGHQELQVPLDMRRSLRARTHNEIKDGFPSVIFVNPDTMDLASNRQAPLYQALYFMEFQETGRVATPCYVIKSTLERYLVMPSYHDEAKNQHRITLSDNLAPHLDRVETEAAVEELVNTVLPKLLPKQEMESSLFQMHGTHDQFYLLKATPHKYYYWKTRPENSSINLTINSTEATQFQLSIKNA